MGAGNEIIEAWTGFGLQAVGMHYWETAAGCSGTRY